MREFRHEQSAFAGLYWAQLDGRQVTRVKKHQRQCAAVKRRKATWVLFCVGRPERRPTLAKADKPDKRCRIAAECWRFSLFACCLCIKVVAPVLIKQEALAAQGWCGLGGHSVGPRRQQAECANNKRGIPCHYYVYTTLIVLMVLPQPGLFGKNTRIPNFCPAFMAKSRRTALAATL